MMRRMSAVSRIRRMMVVERRQSIYAGKNRLISPGIYARLKQMKECQVCKAKLKGRPEIHHVKPVREGGENREGNLVAVCHECHVVLDKKEEAG